MNTRAGAAEFLVDGRTTSAAGHLGFASLGPRPDQHPEWIELVLPAPSTASQVVLYPRTDLPGVGFPVDFTLETWDHGAWVPRVTVKEQERPSAPQTYDLGVHAGRIRLVATKLQDIANDHFMLQLAELELRP